jgi:hypothetical protein
MKAPREGETTVTDMVFGEVTTPNKAMDDMVLLKRDGRVQGHDLVLIGRYRIHPMGRGSYYVDFFPGHRVIMNPDGHGGYRGPAYLGGAVIGSFTLTPKR